MPTAVGADRAAPPRTRHTPSPEVKEVGQETARATKDIARPVEAIRISADFDDKEFLQ
ncbi:hypothetical protein [Dactylosporangium aurantiacum]|uniref:hypothetical protein n=1 Tax=Dactylosporangium aurantiacum TaxID=35754 RepID=UPI0012DE2EB5|nr:hypothetical protein [Dactylosporangium aurantiacum]MDG6103944.1 hypothetical protein [Dactylosporangium aurantiacum]